MDAQDMKVGPEGAPARPLVTFALFAYNQEKYIREAVEGAFSQTYGPLEIILSDDCSADRTFEIMQEMAAAYKGLHRVISVQQSKNLGIIDHVLAVASLAEGELIIVAAGDDISLPSRTEAVASAWLHSGATALYSGWIVMDDQGIEQETVTQYFPMKKIQELFNGVSCARRYNGMVRNIPGLSAAYARSFLRTIPPCNLGANNEDALTTVMANVTGGHIESIASALIKYRQSDDSISPHSRGTSFSSLKTDMSKIVRFSSSSIGFYDYLFNIIDNMETRPSGWSILKANLLQMQREMLFVKKTSEGNIITNIALLLECRRFREYKIVLARLFGVNFLVFLKWAIKNVPI